MATAKKTAAKKTAAKKTAARQTPARKTAARSNGGGSSANGSNGNGSTGAAQLDAIRLLTADHREVKALFQQYQEMVDDEADDEDKHPIAQQICQMLKVHAQIEEEIFYPAAEEEIEENDLVDEAEVEHASAKDLIAQIEASDPSDELFDARVKVLGEYVDHHVKEEEKQMFPQARKAKMDLREIGRQLSERKQQLMSEMGTGMMSGAADEDAGVMSPS